MLDESSYLPYIDRPPPQGPWLVISPHPDDETFGLGGTLLLASGQGIAADVLFLTSGDQGGAEGISAIREKEALEAARLLGIRNVSFWRWPDRSLLPCQAIIDRLAEVIVSTKPACIFFPSPVEPHPDHRASSVIAWEALRKTGFTAEPWSYEVSVQGPVNNLVDISRVATRKREIMAVYSSQMTQNSYIERITGLNQARAWSLALDVSHAEAFYAWPKEDRPLNAMLLALQTHNAGMDAMPDIAAMVSVIILTKNRPDLLREAIVSVATQTHRDIEVVVVNEGGADIGTLVQEYATGSIHKTIYEPLQPGRGRAGAANAGLDLATGEYLLFLDEDDRIAPEHLAKLAHVLELNESFVLAYTDSRKVNGDGDVLGTLEGEFEPYQLMFANRFPIHAALFRRSVVKAGACAFDQQFALFEDWDFWLQLQRQGRFCHVPGASATYKTDPHGLGVNNVSGLLGLEYVKIRDKWRTQWLDNWLADAFDAAHKAMDLDRQAEQLHAELAACKNNLVAVLNSRSWRLTTGLRTLIVWLRHAINMPIQHL